MNHVPQKKNENAAEPRVYTGSRDAPATGPARATGEPPQQPADERSDDAEAPADQGGAPQRPKEIGGRPGPDPTRYGDWEKNGRCIDF